MSNSLWNLHAIAFPDPATESDFDDVTEWAADRIAGLEAQLTAATARADAAETDVRKYGKHLFGCARNSKPIQTASHPDGLLRRPCDCGFEKYWKEDKP